MSKWFLSLIFCWFLSMVTMAQMPQPDAEGSLVKWMTIDEAMEKIKTQPRPIVLDFYTDWCGWCKKMMQTTYANPALAQYINSNFYPVKFNAETKDTIEYLGVKYGPASSGPRSANTLAIKLLQGSLSYPSTLFLNNYDKTKNEFQFSMLSQGYMEIKRIEPMLVFQLENAFRNSAFEDFEKAYNLSFYDTAITNNVEANKWKAQADFFEKKEKSDKKTLVFVHTEWCNACRVMYRTSFTDPENKEYLSNKFNLVDFNPEYKEPINFKGQTFVNLQQPQAPFHQLATALCRNGLTLPTLVVLDENMNVIDAIPFYLNAAVLNTITHYYGDDIYKVKSWQDYMNEKNGKPNN